MISRREFLKGSAIVAAAAVTAGAIAGCSDGGSAGSASTAAPASAAGASSQASAAAAASSSASGTATAASDSIVVYFSRAGENYSVGVIEQGNTAVLADMIAAKTGADLFQIEPARVYPESYDECCEVALEEQDEGARPAYAGDVDLSAYNTVFLGYPIWWGDLPMCVYTFLEAHDWEGKEVRPFITHAGSGVANTDETLAGLCEGAQVGEPLCVLGKTAQTDRDAAQADVDAWLG